MFTIQTAVPVALAPVLFHESFAATPGGGVPLGLALALVLAGAAVLVRSPLLTNLYASGTPAMAPEPFHPRVAAPEQAQATPPAAGAVPDAGRETASAVPAKAASATPAEDQRARVSAESDSAESPSAPSHATTPAAPRSDVAEPETPTTSTSPARARR